MEKLYRLNQIKLQDRTKVGDKAFQLSKLIQRGYPVLPGFVVSARVLQEFLETLNSSEALVADLPHSSFHLDVANWRQLQYVARLFRQEITQANLPPRLLSSILEAVREQEATDLNLILRPSVVAPTAKQGLGNISGLLESQVCSCDEQAIAVALKQVWSQIFRAKSLLYWQWAGVDLRQINLGVLVQPFRNASASGVLNATASEWEILATWGLGLSISQGEVLPDVFYIQPDTGHIREQEIGNKTIAYRTSHPTSIAMSEAPYIITDLLAEDKQKQYALTEEYLQQLVHLASQLVKEIGANFTIEWTISNETATGVLYITQISIPQSAISNVSFIKGLGAATGRVSANAHAIAHSQPKPEKIPKGVILVLPNITPDWLPLLQHVAGIVTEQGGLTSHAAILARELSIPAVVSVKHATKIIQTGERLQIDGERGEIYRVVRREEEIQQEDASVENEKFTVQNLEPLPQSLTPSQSLHLPIIGTQLLVNVSQPSAIAKVHSLPVDGVGLLRSELMVLNILEGKHPSVWIREGERSQLLEKWYAAIAQFASAFEPKPVFYRSLDWRDSELRSLENISQTAVQSVLGERGTYSYLINPAVFELELAALAKVQKAGYSNIHLLLPFVRTVEEFSFCYQKVEQAKLTQVKQFQLWIMAEVPSILFLLPEYVKAGVQGISIGTNDLTQLLLGVDREQGHLARVFNESHPVVMDAIARLIEMAQKANIPCSLCGQAPVLYPEIIEQLVRGGITSISVEPEAVERTYRAIARAEQKVILEAARRQLKDKA
ncbi:putative PEP-binding protein [Scytonema sp. NUACC26]|uniref:putative PEP-binding protein n=1 Tax=Scytonema sp. NUACC26 TaxID=3140176 RepID=UPI0034DCBDDB